MASIEKSYKPWCILAVRVLCGEGFQGRFTGNVQLRSIATKTNLQSSCNRHNPRLLPSPPAARRNPVFVASNVESRVCTMWRCGQEVDKSRIKTLCVESSTTLADTDVARCRTGSAVNLYTCNVPSVQPITNMSDEIHPAARIGPCRMREPERSSFLV